MWLSSRLLTNWVIPLNMRCSVVKIAGFYACKTIFLFNATNLLYHNPGTTTTTPQLLTSHITSSQLLQPVNFWNRVMTQWLLLQFIPPPTSCLLRCFRSSTVTGGHVYTTHWSVPQVESGALCPTKWANNCLHCVLLHNLWCWQRYTVEQVSSVNR